MSSKSKPDAVSSIATVGGAYDCPTTDNGSGSDYKPLAAANPLSLKIGDKPPRSPSTLSEYLVEFQRMVAAAGHLPDDYAPPKRQPRLPDGQPLDLSKNVYNPIPIPAPKNRDSLSYRVEFGCKSALSSMVAKGERLRGGFNDPFEKQSPGDNYRDFYEEIDLQYSARQATDFESASDPSLLRVLYLARARDSDLLFFIRRLKSVRLLREGRENLPAFSVVS
jgi:hypothetical protein